MSDPFAVDRLYQNPAPNRNGLYSGERFPPVDLNKLKIPNIGNNWYTAARKTKENRNDLQAYLIRYSNRICDNHKAAIVANRAVFNLFSGLANVGIGAAGALVSGGASQVLSAISAGISGGQAVVNSEIYAKYLAPAIVKRIDIDRKSVALELAANRAKMLKDYSVDDAVLAVQKYHLECSFYKALASLSEEGAKAPDDMTNITKLIELEEKKLEAINAELSALEAKKKGKDDVQILAIKREIESKKKASKFL